MKSWQIKICFFFLLLCFIPPALAQNSDELLLAGDAAFQKRSDSDSAVIEAIKYWDRAFAANPNEAAPLYRLAMAYSFLGRFAKNDAAVEKYFLKGHKYAKSAVEKNQKSAASHYWWSVTLYYSVRHKNKFAKLAVHGDITAHLLMARKIDPDYRFGGPDRELGRVALISPIPSMQLALKYLGSCNKIAPEFSENALLLAKALIKDKQFARARPYLEKVLSLKPMPGYEKELKDDQNQAGELLKSLDLN